MLLPRIIFGLALCVPLALSTGCNSSTPDTPETPAATVNAPGASTPAPTTTSMPETPATPAAGDGHDAHGGGVSAGTITVGGATMTVATSGSLPAGGVLRVDLVHTSGPAPVAVRMWIGDEAATGTMKSRAGGHDNHFHGSAEVPASIAATDKLWIEAETAAGERVATSVELPS